MTTITANVTTETSPKHALESLSPREVEIFHLLVADWRNREIAEKLKISVRTVESHRRHLLRKLDTRSTVGLVHFAYKAGLV